MHLRVSSKQHHDSDRLVGLRNSTGLSVAGNEVVEF
jgi:hypothetical protein